MACFKRFDIKVTHQNKCDEHMTDCWAAKFPPNLFKKPRIGGKKDIGLRASFFAVSDLTVSCTEFTAVNGASLGYWKPCDDVAMVDSLR